MKDLEYTLVYTARRTINWIVLCLVKSKRLPLVSFVAATTERDKKRAKGLLKWKLTRRAPAEAETALA